MMPPRSGAGHTIPRDASLYGERVRPPEYRKLWLPPEQIVISNGSGNPTAQVDVDFLLHTPSVQCRTLLRLGVEFEQSFAIDELGSTISSSVNGFPSGFLLWIAHVDPMSGRGQSLVPVQNIAGTKATPVQFPTDTGLFGYTVEAQSAGGLIFGRVTVPSQTPDINCSLWARAEFQATDPMSDQEWRALIGEARLEVKGARRLVDA